MAHNSNAARLISLLKVFDVDYASDDDCDKLQGLSSNNSADVAKAVNLLLMPEFARYIPVAQDRLITLLRTCLADPKEDFSELFERVAFVFDDEVMNPRAFMLALLNAIETAQN